MCTDICLSAYKMHYSMLKSIENSDKSFNRT